MAIQLKGLDAEVLSLSSRLAVRTLMLEMEHVYQSLEAEALDFTNGVRAGGGQGGGGGRGFYAEWQRDGNGGGQPAWAGGGWSEITAARRQEAREEGGLVLRHVAARWRSCQHTEGGGSGSGKRSAGKHTAWGRIGVSWGRKRWGLATGWPRDGSIHAMAPPAWLIS